MPTASPMSRFRAGAACSTSASRLTPSTAYDLAQQRKLPITLTMGRPQMDALVSFYMRTPSGFDMEFGAGGALLDDDFVQLDPSNPELWGHKQLIRGWAPTVLSVAK